MIKYVAEVMEMPRWSTMNYKPSCSKWWDPSERIYGKYDGVEGGEGESKEIGGSRTLPDRKGSLDKRVWRVEDIPPRSVGRSGSFIHV